MKLFPDPDETIEGVGRGLRSGERTCVDVLESCLARVEEWEPKVRAWVVVDRAGALAQARHLDQELAAGTCRGPLHGVPIGIKDLIDVEGLPTAAGFAPWRDRVAGRDALIVTLLRNAGAVILGKTVTTQFAWIDPPVTRNPWDLSRTPGGSSSGSAAAVACGMCLGAIGTQTGGSIIRPASFCGVSGLKLAYDTTLFPGIVPFAPSLDHPGPIARTVRDLALLFDAINPLEAEEMSWGPSPSPTSEIEARFNEFDATIRATPPPSLLRLSGFSDRRADPVMMKAFEVAWGRLAGAGAEVTERADDAFDFEGILGNHRVMMAAEAAAEHEERLARHRDDFAPHIRRLVEEGLALPAPRYVRAHQHWRACYEEHTPRLQSDCEAIVAPATVGPAPDRSTTGDPCLNSPWSYLGWPAASFPIGLDSDGLPLAIQVIGGPGSWDSALLRTAAWCEAVIRRAYNAVKE